MQSKLPLFLRWAGAACLLLLTLQLMIEGTWATGRYHSWPFVVLLVCTTILLLIAGIGDLKSRRWWAAASHCGLSLVFIGGMLGSVAETDVKMVVDRHASERVAYKKSEETYVLPFSIRLADFRISYYADGTSPQQYTSTVSIDGSEKMVSVNHPLRYKGWWIYQYDYDRVNQDFAILQLVRDPWLPVVYVGMLLLLCGALLQVRRAFHSWKVWPAVILLAGAFTAASLARIELGTLVPALRSFWFFPHILVYMIAYSLLAIVLVMGLCSLFRSPKVASAHQQESCSALLTTVSALLLIGMLCGAAWAKDAWGSYWTWDAKECWAAATWLITVLGTHCPGKKSFRRLLLVTVLTFAAMQITWYGVNYLPSAQYSMHTYIGK